MTFGNPRLDAMEAEVRRLCGEALEAAAAIDTAQQRLNESLANVYKLANRAAVSPIGVDMNEHERLAYERLDINDHLFTAIRRLVIATGSIAAILWGLRGHTLDRTPLRNALEVTDDSPVKNRAVRNAFEHFDERLEAAGPIIDRNLGAIGSLHASRSSILRHYDPASRTVYFAKDELHLPELLGEIQRIERTASKRVQSRDC